ncbi:PREDICTED: uncharacterized protein LOC105569800 [Vollenhovia emeryi]|uniref:uncharacterized protein LOC105569800 n=1 Tax=Vollenhovia emeryi TaxID=411798 RepID=UPI0005F548E0|nr:PREDICTED: uncharacterized protein LOC105569800 [Vollenhovia emeryi]
MVLALIGPHPESATPHLHPYISEFRYDPRYHPSRNPDCALRSLRHEFYNERLGHEDRRHFSFEGPLVDQDHPWIEIRAVLTNTREEFVLVDHILDPVQLHKIRLRNPYVIKVRQEPLLHLYGLRLQGVVNAGAREEVINNHRANFTGCNDGLGNPTCGQMLVDGEPILFSQASYVPAVRAARNKTTDRFQGFCCSCEDAQRAESFRSVAAKSNYYQRDDGTNRARNRSVSSANLFDNSEAQRQVEVNGKEGHNRQVENGDARGRVTSRNTSAVNGPLGEQASPFRKQQQEKEQLKNNSVRQRIRLLEGFPRTGRANHTTSLQSVLENVFSDPSPKGKIEAYIDAVYEQAMKQRAMEQAVKHESDKRSKDLLDENDLSTGNVGDSDDRFRKSDRRILDRRISDGRPSINGPITDNLQDTTTKFTNIDDYDSRALKSRKASPQSADRRSDDRFFTRGSVADDPRNPTTKLTKLESEQGFTKIGGKEDNREFLEFEKRDRSANFSESGNREEMARGRSRGVQPENTFDYTPTTLAIHPRIPEVSHLSSRTEKNTFLNDTLHDNGAFSTTIEFLTRPGIPFGNNTDEDINCAIASSTARSNSFEENAFALLSRIMASTGDEERQYGFRALKNITDNVNALRNASAVRKNLSAAAIQRDNTNGEEGKTENANVSTRISAVPAFTRLRNLSSPVGIPRLEELSAPAARSEDKSLTKILESKTRGSLPAGEIQGFPGDLGDLYKGRESRGMHNSAGRAPKDVNLKNSYKFWKPRRKLRKSKGAAKFRGDKGLAGELKRFGKPSRGSTRKRALSDFERDSFRNEFSKGERRFRRHLRAGKGVFSIANARGDGLTGEGSSGETQAFVHYYTRPETASSKRNISNTGNEGPKKRVISESGHSRWKVQPEENDNPFHFNNKDGKKNSVDKRIEDKFVRISNVLKEDSTETGIIRETPENFEVVTRSEVAKADIPKIPAGSGDNLFSRENGKSDELFAIHDDEITHERPAELNDTRRRLTASENSIATTGSTMTSDEAATLTSLATRKDSSGHPSVFSKPVIDPFLSSSIMRKQDYNITKKIDLNGSKNPICATEFAMEQTDIPRGENVSGYVEVTDSPLRTLSSDSASSKEVTETLNNRSDDERDKLENTRFLELNNGPSRIIAGNFVKPEGPPIDSGLPSRGSTWIIEPKEISLSNEEEADSRYTEDPPLENSASSLERSREKEEIAELVDRIARQYAAFTPIMPGMPTFDEITEAETLPPEEETTVTRFTTTLATATRITDVAFRPSIRPLATPSLPGEMHDEVSLDETTFVDETEATTTTREKTASKPRFRPGRPDANTSARAKVRKVSSRTGKHETQKVTNRVTSMKMTNAKGEAEEHPWYRTTEMQQLIAANRSQSARRTEGKGRKHRYEPEADYFQNTSSARTSSTTVPSGVAQTRGKRSDLIRAAGNRDSSVFYVYASEDEETRPSGRAGLNKNEKSPNTTESTELRSTIEKRLVGELDYPASRGSSRHSCESRDQAQKLDAALRDIAARNVGLRAVKDNLDLDARRKDVQDSLKNLTRLRLRQVKDGADRQFDKDISSRNREATSASLGASGPTKIPSSRTDLSGSVRARSETDRRSEKPAFDERTAAEIGRIAVARKIAASAEPREKWSAGGILRACARSPGSRDKSRETDTVICSVKLMIPDDKGETRELGVAAKSADKKIPLLAARQRGREDARKINENPADCRVSAGRQYLRRPRGKVYDTVRKIINKIKGKLSSVSNEADTERDLAASEKRADRSPPDWHQPGRRLLSSGESDYLESIDDEYYANDESEAGRENDSSDNEAIGKRDDLSYLENRSGVRENRNSRKLVAAMDRLIGRSADVARAMPEERTAAVCDAAMFPDDTQASSEEAVSRPLFITINYGGNYRNIEKKVKNKSTDFQDTEVSRESTDLTSFNDDKMLEVPLEAEEKSIVRSIVDNKASVREKEFDNSENILRNSRGKEINEEPFSFREKINENNLSNGIREESPYDTQSTFNTRETVSSLATNNQNLSSAGRLRSNIDLSRSSATSKNEGNIKISLIGRIQVHSGFNQTPMLISFDAVPDESSATRSSVSALSNTVRAIETTTINLPLNDSNVESTLDLLSMGERGNDEAGNSLKARLDESREAEKTNAGEVRIKSGEMLFDLTRGSGEGRKMGKKNRARVKKRLDKYNANSRSAKQVFLTDRSVEPDGKADGTSVGRAISERAGGTIGKLDSRSSANPVYFPDIFGSVLVNNASLKDHQDVSKEPRRRIDVPATETNRSNSIGREIDPANTTTLRVAPLVHVSIEKPSDDPANYGGTRTCCSREDPRNATSGGCYRMPATVRELEITETTSRELQTWSNYRNGDPTETFPPGVYETTVNDRNAVTMRSSPSSTRLQNGVLETATLSSKCNDDSINAIRVRNMMAIVRFMMKLLRVIAEDGEPPGPRTQVGETVIHVKNVVINASSHVERQKDTTDGMIKSGGTRQDLTTAEWRSTERTREGSSPLGDGTFEPFTVAPSHPAASTSPDQVSKDEGLSTLFETSAGKEVYATTLSSRTSFATPKSFLFYEPAQKSPRKDASRKNTTVELTGVRQNSNGPFKGSKDEPGGKKSRLDGSQTNRSSSWLRDRDRSSVDRLHFGKQGIATTTNPEDEIGSSREKYLARGKNAAFRRSGPTGVANDNVRSILARGIGVSRNALLERIGAAGENRPGRSKSKRAGRAGVSDRRAETRTKLLNRSTRAGPPGDWIGEHRAATRRLAIDKELRESREAPGGTATPGKVVFRRVRGKINRPSDPNLVSGRSDSFKIEGNVAGNGPLAKLSTDDALSAVDGELSSLEREDTSSANAIRYSTSSLMNDNAGTSKIGRETVDERTRSHKLALSRSVPYKKRDVSERRDFRKGNRVLGKRQKASSPMRRETKQRRKKKRKKGSRRTKDISATESPQRFKRHLLMTSLEPEYDVDDAARFSRRHDAAERKNAERFRKPARGDASRRRKRDGSRTVDGPEADPGTAQIRGGQDCTDRRHPPNIDAAKYLESAHCLRFSDLWYSVYQLEDPIVEHVVYLQVYEKRALANGSTYWEDLTRDSVVRSFMPSDWARSTGTIEAAKIRSLSLTRK